MLISLAHHDWQLCRYIVRAGRARRAKGIPGRELRMYPARKNKNGQFLDTLVSEGLLVVVPGESPTPPDRKAEPEQFKKLYDLTTLGEHAAEYGEYEKADGKRLPTPEEFYAARAAEQKEKKGKK